MLGLIILQIMVIVVAIRFMIICVWKSMRQMDDNFIAFVCFSSSVTTAVILGCLRPYGPGKPTMNMIICTGVYNPDLEILGKPFPIGHPLTIGTLFGIYMVSTIAISIKKKQIKKNEVAVVGHHQQPKSLESLFLNAGWIFFMLMICWAIIAMNKLVKFPHYYNSKFSELMKLACRLDPIKFQEPFYWILPVFIFFIAPAITSGLTAIRILIKHGKDIKNELFGPGNSIQPFQR